ncbi:MAG: TIM44-like domain-containing protein [Clostridia bacterium]|nr:TIM44-like domain-containing protein [Clostridia bacterium]
MSKPILYFVCYSIAAGKSEFSLFSIVIVALAALSAFIAFVVFRYKLSKKARNAKKLISMLERKDDSFKYETLNKTVREAYFMVQKSLASGDLSYLSEYVSEDFANEFKEKLLFARTNADNYGKYKLKEIVPVVVNNDSDDSRDHIWFYVNGNSTNYDVDVIIDNQFGSNNKGAKMPGEYWQFVRGHKGWVLNKILLSNEYDNLSH